ncbi:CHAT domain-containing protein [Winogradskyella schleiferi]|uniref:CHAT domain-containing protein n=1 Tax=Winogradskyella schleiferi TaxID=2686078 RepID=UPI0015B98BF2|nr:CHAT domain-containing tetratricopeptide repeat protein [Winogradskyella schleiferi]
MRRFYNCSRHPMFYILVLSLFQMSFAQQDSISGLKVLDKLISEKKLDIAQQKLNFYLDRLITQESYYEATDYIYFIGKLNFELKNSYTAEKAVLDFGKRISSSTTDPKTLRQLKLEIGSFYEFLGDDKTASDYNLEAIEFTKKMPDKNGELFGIIYSNLGTFNMRMGNQTTALKYHKKALEFFNSYSDTNKQRLYITNNALGGMMWYVSKIDSALVYYKKAEHILSSLEQNPDNKYLRPAILNNNMAGIHNIQGDVNASINAMQKTITNLNLFLKSDITEARRDYAQEFLFQAIDNYGGIYKDIRDYRKAKELIEYSFHQKRRHLSPESPEISKGKILLGQINLALKEYDEAEKYLNEGILELNENPSNYFNWLADAYYYKARVLEEIKDIESAFDCYEKAEEYYKSSLGEYYDELYLDFVDTASGFYAENGYSEKALKMANKAHDYIVANQGEKTLLEYHQVVNLAGIYYILKDYTAALEKSKLALNLLNDETFTKNTKLGKLKIEVQKPRATIIKVVSEYQLKKTKDSIFLKTQLKELQDAITIIEEQKSKITDDNTISMLISDHIDIFEFTKKIALELYEITQSKSYLKVVLGMHESMLYNRIRNRLNSKTFLTFDNIPKTIIEDEKRIKQALSSSILKDDALESFFQANREWEEFLVLLKKDYPMYHDLKYAAISKSIHEQIENKNLENKTLVRYTFIDGKLYVFVIHNRDLEVFNLETKNLTKKINSLQSNNPFKELNFETLNDLYLTLWQPIAGSIKTNKVTIVPDQVLFNLNFEMLTKSLVNSYQELVDHSLLNTYTISYNYSLFLINQSSIVIDYTDNFIAFAPEFNSKMKTDYQLTITDSISLDKTYLTLLPQPFATALAKQYTKLFNGKSFLNENASKQIFTEQAKEHKIIHIGTHAESNNISPELSRLIFAKNVNDTIYSEDNSLYTYEIYNQNLSSNLAILTACETGKPTFQPGEGMISLAHAFNYAGSESILTSLWKIDEQSSVAIIENFYRYLKKGLPKDEALKKAKLDYIATAEGRTVSPQYWAGLVLIGDTAPINLTTSSNLVFWLLGIIGIIIIIVILRKFKK